MRVPHPFKVDDYRDEELDPRMSELNALIASGWGDRPGRSIPDSWRDLGRGRKRKGGPVRTTARPNPSEKRGPRLPSAQRREKYLRETGRLA